MVVGVTSAAGGHATAAPRPAQDGQILYEVQDPAFGDVVPLSVNPDGSHAHQLYSRPMECPHWSPDGTQIANCGAPDGDTTILTVDTGRTRFLPSVAAGLHTPCYVWSSESTHLACEAFSDDDPSHNGIFTVRVSDWGDPQRLTTNNGGSDIPGDYSPDSKRLVFGRSFADEDANPALFRINTNGTGLRRLTPPELTAASQGSWSPIGNHILFSGRIEPDHRQSLWVVHADGTGLHSLEIQGIPCGGAFDDPTSVGCSNPVWSPTGRQIVFRVNSATGSIVERADSDGSHPSVVANLGFDPGDFVDWGTHPLATGQ